MPRRVERSRVRHEPATGPPARQASAVGVTGTITDAVVVAWTGCGPRVPYLGPGTVAGWCLARAVRQAVGEGIPS
jgi:adenosylcobinamide amidohydrolase